MSLGRFFFEDEKGNKRDTYIDGALSLDAVENFANTIITLTTATIQQVSWSADAYVWFDENKMRQVTLFQPESYRTLGGFGSPLPGLTCLELAAFRLVDRVRPVRRSFTIPAPVFGIFDGAEVNRSVGESLCEGFNTLTGTNCRFQSGRLIKPKKIQAMGYTKVDIVEYLGDNSGSQTVNLSVSFSQIITMQLIQQSTKPKVFLITKEGDVIQYSRNKLIEGGCTIASDHLIMNDNKLTKNNTLYQLVIFGQ